MRTVLIVSPHFPPATLASVHRARHLAKHLPTFGWRPIVVRVAPENYVERLDPGLAELVPANVEQIHCDAAPAAATVRFCFSDIGLRAYPQLVAAVRRTVRSERPSAVMITGSPYYPMLMARSVARGDGVPILLDFQDPWVSVHGATVPHWSKEGLSHRLGVLLEPRALRHAAWITSVSDTQNDEMVARYPWLDRNRMSAIPIGGDPEDFDALRSKAELASEDRGATARITFSYVGTFLPHAEPVLRRLFRGFRVLRSRHPALAEKIRFNFVGSSNQTALEAAPVVSPVAVQEGVADALGEMPYRVPFLDALSILATSHALLLIGSDEPHYTASKIYPAMMSKTPYLSLFHARSSAHEILAAAGGGRALAFSSIAELDALVPQIADGLAALALNRTSFGVGDPAAYADFTAESVARSYGMIFEHLDREHRRTA